MTPFLLAGHASEEIFHRPVPGTHEANHHILGSINFEAPSQHHPRHNPIPANTLLQDTPQPAFLLGAMSAKDANGIGVMAAEERTAMCENGYVNGIGVMAAEDRTAACEHGHANGIGAMAAEDRTAACENGDDPNGIGVMAVEDRKAACKKGYANGIGAMSAEEKTVKWIGAREMLEKDRRDTISESKQGTFRPGGAKYDVATPSRLTWIVKQRSIES
jgi:hypothetical protein